MLVSWCAICRKDFNEPQKSTSGVWRGGSGVDHEYVHQEAVLPLICLLLILIYTWGLLLYGASIVAYTENNTPADLKNEGRWRSSCKCKQGNNITERTIVPVFLFSTSITCQWCQMTTSLRCLQVPSLSITMSFKDVKYCRFIKSCCSLMEKHCVHRVCLDAVKPKTY